ncbi:MAG TPA: alpha/beta fold hydrolase [Gemmatimonadaceae bacterium]|nr:alpha/beta fold hydrolase [Gemmatimonadaceae bacterium]
MEASSTHIPSPSPGWLDRSLYPFASHWFDSADGRMHYVDEGAGTPVVFVHGTPTWSFLWRHLIARLAPRHRVIAVDHLGFGLSEKPPAAPYEPADHARRLVALLDSLDLSGATLVVHDFGGPIGLAAALGRSDRFARIALFNSWLWPLGDDPAIARGARLAGSRLGRLLYRHLNFPVKVLMPKVMGNRSALTPEVHRHYAAPLATPDERMGAWAFARSLLGAGSWFEELWAQRARLRLKPVLLLWGMKDPTFGPDYLARWRRELPEAEVHTFPSSGHFVPEEAPAEAGAILERFVGAPDADVTARLACSLR